MHLKGTTRWETGPKPGGRANEWHGHAAATIIRQDNRPLSPRERQIVLLVLAGESNKQVARRLCISEKTVKNHVTSVYRKIGCHTRMEMAAICRRDATQLASMDSLTSCGL